VRQGFKLGVPYFLFVGGIEPRKNLVGMLRACLELAGRQTGRPFQIVLIGDNSQTTIHRALICSVRKEIPVVLPGYLPDSYVPGLMAGAQAFLFPSFTEGFGIPMLEAMSAGTIVIAGNTGAMPEVAGPNALYCDPCDHGSIADAMDEVLTMSASDRDRRIQNGRAHAANFTWQNTVDNFITLLRETK
jgi:glycosyltransferase involved in cell wall biosynthesis